MNKYFALTFLVGLISLDLFAIQVAPTYQIFTVKKGDQVEGQCTVTNNEEQNLNINIYSKDWFVVPGNEKFKATDWLTFKEKEFPLKKGESKVVHFVVSGPKDAKGELIGMMSLALKEEIPTDVNKVFSVAIYAALDGTEKLKGDVKAIMVSPSTHSLLVSILMENKGNVHIRPSGFFEVRNSKDQTVANILIRQGQPTYPGKEGVYTGQVNDLKVLPGNYKCVITLTDIDRKTVFVQTTRKFEILENYSVELR